MSDYQQIVLSTGSSGDTQTGLVIFRASESYVPVVGNHGKYEALRSLADHLFLRWWEYANPLVRNREIDPALREPLDSVNYGSFLRWLSALPGQPHIRHFCKPHYGRGSHNWEYVCLKNPMEWAMAVSVPLTQTILVIQAERLLPLLVSDAFFLLPEEARKQYNDYIKENAIVGEWHESINEQMKLCVVS